MVKVEVSRIKGPKASEGIRGFENRQTSIRSSAKASSFSGIYKVCFSLAIRVFVALDSTNGVENISLVTGLRGYEYLH